MPFRTKPYVRFGLGQAFRAVEYVVDEERIKEVGLITGNDVASIARAGASAVRDDQADLKWLSKKLRRAFDIGDVRVSGSSGVEHTFKRVVNVASFISAVEGTHPVLIADRIAAADAIRERDKFLNLTENDMADDVLYFPHIPKAVNRLLQTTEPAKYRDGAYVTLARQGEYIRRGGVIAKYGDIEVTSPVDGRIEFVGGSVPGLHEWPAPSGQPFIIDEYYDYKSIFDGDAYRATNENDRGCLVFPSTIKPTECYSFGIRPLKFSKPGEPIYYQSMGIRYAFNHGDVWLDMEREKGYSFYSIIDMAVFNIKDAKSGTPLPQSLKDDKEYKKELARYWPLINTSMVMKRPAKESSPNPGPQSTPV